MKRLTIISLLLTVTATLAAQETIRLIGVRTGADTQVSVQNASVANTNQKTFLTMDFILDELELPSNKYRAVTPVIRSADGQQEQRLKTLIVSGRRQNIVFQRDGIDNLYAANCDNIRRENGKAQSYSYADATDTQPWFSNADLFVECDLCGCGNRQDNDEVPIMTLLPPDPYDLVALTDVVPAPSKKERNLHGSAYITFVVDRWEMKPDYMDNRRELRKITDTLDVMAADPNVSVREIKIHGYASPESPYTHNSMLATNRAKSLTEWLKKQYSLPANVFAPAEATPENWEGLRKAVVQMTGGELGHRQEILDKIDKVLADLGNNITNRADADEHAIRAAYPNDYRYLLREVYPGLRRSDYDISFNFSDFTLEQAKEIYKRRPYQLSLRELWDVAQTMEPGSDAYNRVMQQAVNIYPDDPVANLNLANVAIRQRDLLKATTLLEKAGDSAEAINARAVVAIVQQRYADAEALLQQAAQKGLDVTKNLEAIRLLKK